MFIQETSRKGQLGLFQLEKTEFQKLDKNQIPLPDSKVPKDCTELPLVARMQMAEAKANVGGGLQVLGFCSLALVFLSLSFSSFI